MAETTAEDLNPFHIAQHQFDNAVRYIPDLKAGLRDYLKLPDRVIVRLNPDAALPDDHPAAGKGLVDDRPAAYVCAGPVCSLPLTDPETLREDLRNR